MSLLATLVDVVDIYDLVEVRPAENLDENESLLRSIKGSLPDCVMVLSIYFLH